MHHSITRCWYICSILILWICIKHCMYVCYAHRVSIEWKSPYKESYTVNSHWKTSDYISVTFVHVWDLEFIYQIILWTEILISSLSALRQSCLAVQKKLIFPYDSISSWPISKPNFYIYVTSSLSKYEGKLPSPINLFI